jgi:hypothetical protein
LLVGCWTRARRNVKVAPEEVEEGEPEVWSTYIYFDNLKVFIQPPMRISYANKFAWKVNIS